MECTFQTGGHGESFQGRYGKVPPARILELAAAGMKAKRIAEVVGMSERTITRALAKKV